MPAGRATNCSPHSTGATRHQLTNRFRTLTIPPEKGYGQRGMGPIPAGSTLSTYQRIQPSLPLSVSSLLSCDSLVFETELLGIDGVPKPESIVLKTSTTTDVPVETAKNFGEKIAEKFAEATDAAKTMLKDTMKDTDDAEHAEL
ncbi:hypothetical protein FJTKL_08413 [Diaporthe vaccinii]|uniref:Peptidylprolyl isomerase n=1 Tax=Diaporthe vaccinii TaxID=105482 RepID=A0ABR4ERY2_9PEZI